METRSVPEVTPEVADFPPVIAEVFTGRRFDLAQFPVLITFGNTRALSELNRFSLEAKTQAVSRLRLVNRLISEPRQRRFYRNQEWETEFIQGWYETVQGLAVSAVYSGAEGVASPGPLVCHEGIWRGLIHSHSGDDPFSPQDLRFLVCPQDVLRPLKSGKYPELTMLAVAADRGFFLTFASEQTLNSADIDAWLADLASDSDLLKLVFTKIWMRLQREYPKEKLRFFLGTRFDDVKAEVFPEGVNQRGIELLHWFFTRDLCQELALPLYFLPHGGTEAEKVVQVEKFFPELGEGQNS